MRRYFLSELKRNRNALIVLTALCAVLAFAVTSTIRLFVVWEYDHTLTIYSGDGAMGLFCGMLIALCVFTPVYSYSFKMKKRSVDAYYSLPIRRESLYFVKTLIGLLLTFVPYTVAYVLGVGVISCRENYFQMGWYIPYYFVSVAFGVLLYLFYAFIFTRANTTADGVVFMIAWTFVVELVLSVLAFALDKLGVPESVWGVFNASEYLDLCHFPFAFLTAVADGFSDLLGNSAVYVNNWEAHALAFTVLSGVACGVLFFTGLRREKAENAEQISSSWWGYKTLVPVYAFTISAQTTSWVGWCVTFIAAFVGFVVYRRSLKLKTVDWISLAVALLLGIILSANVLAAF